MHIRFIDYLYNTFMVLWAFFNISLIIFHEKSHMGWNTCHTLEQHINEEQNFYLWLIYPFKYKALTSIGCQPHFPHLTQQHHLLHLKINVTPTSRLLSDN